MLLCALRVCLLSITRYAHGWYTETGRDLTKAAVEEAVRWRDEWFEGWRAQERRMRIEVRKQGGPRSGGGGSAPAPPPPSPSPAVPELHVVGSISPARLRYTHEQLRSMRDSEETRQVIFRGVGGLLLMYGLLYTPCTALWRRVLLTRRGRAGPAASYGPQKKKED